VKISDAIVLGLFLVTGYVLGTGYVRTARQSNHLPDMPELGLPESQWIIWKTDAPMHPIEIQCVEPGSIIHITLTKAMVDKIKEACP